MTETLPAWDDDESTALPAWDDDDESSFADSVLDVLKAVPAGVHQAGATIVGATQGAGAGILGALGDTEGRDRNFREMEKTFDAVKSFWGDRTTGTGKVVQGVAGSLPLIKLAALGALGATLQSQHELDQAGVSPAAAQRVAVTQGAANLALGAVPIVKPLAASVGNAAIGAATDKISSNILKQEGFSKQAEMFDPTDPVNRLVDLVVGGVGSKAYHNKTEINQKKTFEDTQKKLDEIDAKNKPLQFDTGLSLVDKETPSTIERPFDPRVGDTGFERTGGLETQLDSIDFPSRFDAYQKDQRIYDLREQVEALAEKRKLEQAKENPDTSELTKLDREATKLIKQTEEIAVSEYGLDRGGYRRALYESDIGRVFEHLDILSEGGKGTPRPESGLKMPIEKTFTLEPKSADENQTGSSRNIPNKHQEIPVDAFGYADKPTFENGLKWIAQKANKAPERALANLLLDFGKKVDISFQWAKNRLGDIANVVHSSTDPNTGITRTAVASHQATSEGSLITSSKRGSTVENMLHEGVHAGTVKYMETRPTAPLTMEMVRIYGQVISKAPERFYGLKNAFEFVTAAMTNHDFQKWLSTHTVEGKPTTNLPQTVWRAVTKTIAKMMGRDSPDINNALDRVVWLGEEMIHDYMKNAEAITKDYVNLGEKYRPLFSPESALKLNGKVLDSTILEALDNQAGGSKERSEYEGSKFQPEKEASELIKGPLSKVLSENISPDPNVEQLLPLMRAEEDTPIRNSLQSGISLTALKTKSVILQTVGRIFQNARKRANLTIEQNIVPIEHSLRNLIASGESQSVWEVFKREMFNERRYTPEELKSVLSEKGVDFYNKLRSAFDLALEKQNEVRVARGKQALAPLDAYLSSRWVGNFAAEVRDSHGKLLWVIRETSKLKLAKAKAYIEANYPTAVVSDTRIIESASAKSDLSTAYDTFVKVMGKDDPRVQEIRSLLEEMDKNEGWSALAQSKHFEEKGNIRGFAGDRPWRNQQKEAISGFQQQFEYLKNAFKWSELNSAVDKVQPILKDTEIKNKSALSFSRDYIKNNLGMSDKAWVRGLENSISSLLGVSPSALYGVLGVSKSVFYLQRLAFSLGFSTANTIQFAYTIPSHALLTGEGYSHDPVKTTLRSGSDSAKILAYVAGLKTGESGKHLDKQMTPFCKAMLQYMQANGVIRVSPLDEVRDLSRPQFVHDIENVAGKTMTIPEQIARTTAFTSFSHHLAQSGKFTDALSLFQKAQELTDAFMVSYEREERPMMFNQFGLLGEALSTLQTFKFNYFNQLGLYYDAALKGNSTPLIYFMGVQMALGGVLGLPFMQEIEDIWEFAKKHLMSARLYNQVKDISPKAFILENTLPMVSHGLLSDVTGVNFSSRFDAGNVVDFGLSPLFPNIADQLKQVSKIANAVADPTAENVEGAIIGSLPPTLAGAFETTTDTFKNNLGLPVSVNNPTQAIYPRNESDTLKKSLGLTSLDESRYNEAIFRQRAMETQTREYSKGVLLDLKKALVAKSPDPDKIRSLAQLYRDLTDNPDWELDKLYEETQASYNLPPHLRAALQAETVSGAKRASKWQNIAERSLNGN